MSKHFIFDLGNVLVNFDVHQLQRAMEKNSGRVADARVPSLQDEEMLLAVETRKITDQEFLDYLNDSKGLDWTLEELVQNWQKIFSINDAGYAIFSELKEKGYPVHFLSNLAWHNMEGIRRNWPNFFDESGENFFSYEMGLHKPDARIYRAALEHLEAKPEECFFLDDREENVDGARAIGMNAHTFSPENMPAIRAAMDAFIG